MKRPTIALLTLLFISFVLFAQSTTAPTGYGFLMGQGYARFPLQDARRATILHAGETPLIGAAAMDADSTLWCVSFRTSSGRAIMENLMKMDRATGELQEVAMLRSGYPVILDMAYEPRSGRMYALAAYSGRKFPSLATMDLTTGDLTPVRHYDQFHYSLAADGNGKLFTVLRENGALGVIVDPATGLVAPVGKGTATGARYISSLAMDRATYRLYWAMCDASGKSQIVGIDPQTGSSRTYYNVAVSGKTAELTGLTVGNTIAAGTPSAPTNFSVTPGSNGALTAQVSWTDPAADKVCVYLNSSLIRTITPMTEGKANSITLTGLVTGYNHIRVVGENASGQGMPADELIWAGTDVPSAVQGLQAVRVAPDSALVTWQAPSGSVHGGYYSPTNVKYRVTRKGSDGSSEIVAKAQRGLSFRERVTRPGQYTYTVQSLSSDYGDSTTTWRIYLGTPAAIPYRCTFASQDEYHTWTIRSGNDYSGSWAFDTYSGGVYNPGLIGGNDEWLISPPLPLEQGKDYYLYVKAYTGSGPNYPRTFNVCMGQTPDTAAMPVLESHTIASRADEEKRIVYRAPATGEYHIAIHDVSPEMNGMLYIKEIAVREKHTGTLEGTVRNPEGETLAGVEVSIDSTTFRAVTDSAGRYQITYIDGRDRYTLRAHLFTYQDYVAADIEIPADVTTTRDIVLQHTPFATVSGTVTDSLGNAVEGARVHLSGNGKAAVTTTDAQGRYELSGMTGGVQTLEGIKARYFSRSQDFRLNADTVVNLTVWPKPLSPSCVNASASQGIVNVGWNVPRDLFRRDNGVAISQNGNLQGTYLNVYGTVWKQPAAITSISWMTTDYMGPHKEMNLWLFDIDADGRPTNTVLYNAMHVPSEGDLQWNRHELPQPVACTNGFYLAVSYSYGMASIATSDGHDSIWPFVPHVQFRNADYRTDKWVSVDGVYINNNYMLRAEGDILGDSSPLYPYRYRVWRLVAGQEGNRAVWTPLTEADGIPALTLADNVAALPEGDYLYAVAAVYPHTESEPSFSPTMHLAGGVAFALSGLNPTPNPVADVLSLGMTCDRAEVYDLTGRRRADASDCDRLDLSHLSPGCYLLRASVAGRASTVKIFKK